MKYALNLAEDGRVLSATFQKYAPLEAIKVDALPGNNISDYLYVNGEFVYNPLPKPAEPKEIPSQLDKIESQVVYTAMMTDTLLEI